ncbi:hypothetical protein GGF32_004336 [Allomyces javanicus]|nr:hypothetical protein GGF32_004336 [Allomyces javanicus]
MESLTLKAAPLAATVGTSNLAVNDSFSDPHLSSLDLSKPTLNVSLDAFTAPALLDLFQELHDNASVRDFLLSFPPPGPPSAKDDESAPVLARLWRGVADLLRANRHLTSLDIVLGPHHVRDTLARADGLNPVLDVLAPSSNGDTAANTTLRQLRLWLLGTSRTSAAGIAIATPVARRAATIACRVVFQYDESAPAAVSATALPLDSPPATTSRRGSLHRRPSRTCGDLSLTPSWPPAVPETAPTGAPRRDGRSDGFLQHLPFALSPGTVSPNGSRPLTDGAGSDYMAQPATSGTFTTADRTTPSSGTTASVYLSLGTEFGSAAASERSSSPLSVSDTLTMADSVADATQQGPRPTIVPPVVIVAGDTEVERIPMEPHDTTQFGSRASALGCDASGAVTPSPGSGSVTPSNRHVRGMRSLVSSTAEFPDPVAPVVICVDEPHTYITTASTLRHPQQRLAAHPGAVDLGNFYKTNHPLQASSMTSMVTAINNYAPLPATATVRAVAGSMPRARKAVLSMTPAAVSRIKEMSKPEALLRVGVKKKGCSGLSYTIDQVSAKQRFDEEVVQDGASILIDSKALLSILGSEMDYVEDKLSAQFVFYNPNVKEACGCGQSFMI